MRETSIVKGSPPHAKTRYRPYGRYDTKRSPKNTDSGCANRHNHYFFRQSLCECLYLLSHYVTANCSPALRGAPQSGEGLKQKSTKIVKSKDLSSPLWRLLSHYVTAPLYTEEHPGGRRPEEIQITKNTSSGCAGWHNHCFFIAII